MDRNQALNDVEEALRTALDGRQSLIWTCLPAIVTAVDLTAMTCEAQPAIQGMVTDEDGSTHPVNLPLLVDVPVCFPSAGGFIITFPMKAGDEVLVVFSSRCIDAWWQSGGVGRPIELRMHDLSDGFAIPGPRSQPNVVSAISSTGIQIRNDAGTSYVEIAADGTIKLVSPTSLTITGDIAVTGDLHVTGTITSDTDVIAVNIPLLTHAHNGVQNGGDVSGGPVP